MLHAAISKSFLFPYEPACSVVPFIYRPTPTQLKSVLATHGGRFRAPRGKTGRERFLGIGRQVVVVRSDPLPTTGEALSRSARFEEALGPSACLIARLEASFWNFGGEMWGGGL